MPRSKSKIVLHRKKETTECLENTFIKTDDEPGTIQSEKTVLSTIDNNHINMATFVDKGRQLIYDSPMAHHSGIILSKLCEQYSEGRNCDLEIRLNERKIFAHKCLIEVFFTNAGAELEKDMFYLDMRQYDTDAVLPLIDMIYSGELRAIPEKVNQVLQVATDVGFNEAIAGSRLYLRLHQTVNVSETYSVKQEPMESSGETTFQDSISRYLPNLNLPSDLPTKLPTPSPPVDTSSSMMFEDQEPSSNVYQVLRVDQKSKSNLLGGKTNMKDFLAQTASGGNENLTVLESSIGKKSKRVELKRFIDAKAAAGTVKTVLVGPPKDFKGTLLNVRKKRSKRSYDDSPGFVDDDSDYDGWTSSSSEEGEPIEVTLPVKRKQERNMATDNSRETEEGRKGTRSLRKVRKVNYSDSFAASEIVENKVMDVTKKKPATTNKFAVKSASAKGSGPDVSSKTVAKKSKASCKVGTDTPAKERYKLVAPTAIVPDGCRSSYAKPVMMKTKFVTETYNNSSGNVQVVTREVPVREPTFRKFLPDTSKDPQVIVVCHPTKPVVKL